MIPPCYGPSSCYACEERVLCEPAIATRFRPVTPVTPVTPYQSGLYDAREASKSPLFVTGKYGYPVTPCNKSILLTEIGPVFVGDRGDHVLTHAIKGRS